eukprot:1702459-Pyramimonas_sp.AAC.1
MCIRDRARGAPQGCRRRQRRRSGGPGLSGRGRAGRGEPTGGHRLPGRRPLHLAPPPPPQQGQGWHEG